MAGKRMENGVENMWKGGSCSLENKKPRPKQEVAAGTRTMRTRTQDQDVVSLALPQTDSPLSGAPYPSGDKYISPKSLYLEGILDLWVEIII